MKILGIIPARGGSIGIKDKNIYPIIGKPLIHYSIEKLISSKIFSKLILTTDSEKIINKCKKFSELNIIKRPKKLATSKSTSESAILHVLDNINEDYDLILLIEPTAPLISIKTIKNLIQIFKNEKKVQLGFCIKKITNSYGDFDGKNFIFKSILKRRRQDRKPIYLEGFGLYMIRTKYFKKYKRLYGKKVRAILLDEIETLDINYKYDLFLFESIIKNYTNFKKFR